MSLCEDVGAGLIAELSSLTVGVGVVMVKLDPGTVIVPVEKILLLSAEFELLPVAVTAPVPVELSIDVAAAKKAEHRDSPALCAWDSSPGLVQLLMRQGTAFSMMADWVGPHWHARSEGPQPAALMAEVRQAVAQAGWPAKS